MKIPSLKKIHPAIIGAVILLVLILIIKSGDISRFLRAQLLPNDSCSDQSDNDGDGNADYPSDLGCLRITDENENQDGECFDRMDNDGDGAVDSADFSCRILFNGESMPKSFCQDGIDNDHDGSIDLFDQGCANAQDHSENN